MTVTDLVLPDRAGKTTLAEVALDAESRNKLESLVKERRYAKELQQYNLPVNNKLLLSGSSGCGKTTTARALATELGKPLLILNLSNVVCARIGETAQNIRQVFDKAARDKSVLFLDEFDHIGKSRTEESNDVGEMRRLVNTLIQLIDDLPEHTLLIAATNFINLIDPALVRRFQVHVLFSLPPREALDTFYDSLLRTIPSELTAFDRIYGISYAEAKDHALTSVKANVIAKLESQIVKQL